MAAELELARVPVRLSTLSREDLLELAVGGCLLSGNLRRRADELINKQTPLPSWCVDDVLLSRDLLSQLFNHLSIADKAAAAVCTNWAAAWEALLQRRRYVRPKLLMTWATKTHDNKKLNPLCGVVLPSGNLCVSDFNWQDRSAKRLRILSTVNGKIIDTMVARFNFPSSIGFHAGHLYVSDINERCVIKLRSLNGAEVARSQELSDAREWGELCIAGDEIFVPSNDRVSVLDALTLQLKRQIGVGWFDEDEEDEEDEEQGGSVVNSCTVHGQELYVAESMARTVHVFSLQGEHLRAIEGPFGHPFAIGFHQGYLWLLESEYNNDPENPEHYLDHIPGIEWAGRRLVLLDPTDGTVRQVIRLPDEPDRAGHASSFSFHGDRVYVYGGPHHAFIYVIELTQLVAGPSVEPQSRVTRSSTRSRGRVTN